MSVSICSMVWNEEEFIAQYLTYFNSLPCVDEICLVMDTKTDDATMPIINEIRPLMRANLKITWREMDSFGNQSNAALDMATSEWTLVAGIDETFTQALAGLLWDLPGMQQINAIRIPTLLMCRDTKHYHLKRDLDYHTRIFRTGFVKNKGVIHQEPLDVNGRNVHNDYGRDILDTVLRRKYIDVWLKNYANCRSNASLERKARKWHPIFSGEPGEPTENVFLDYKKNAPEFFGVGQLPPEWYDVTTDGYSLLTFDGEISNE